MFLFFIFMLGVLCGCSKSVQVIIAQLLSWAIAGVIFAVILGVLYIALLVFGEFILLPIFVFIDSYPWMQDIVFFSTIASVVGMYWKIIRDCRKECKARKEWEIQNKKT